MTLDQLKNELKSSDAARAKFIAASVEFYEKLGVDLTDDIVKKFDADAIKAVTGAVGGGAMRTNIIAVF
jgi:major membrane immunogen (membrane-anchored lipoprotein)